MAWTEITSPVPIEDCPAQVIVPLHVDSNVMRYFEKWSGCQAQTGDTIYCPAVQRQVILIIASDGNGNCKILCQELEEGKCNFPQEEDEEEALPETQ